MIVCSSQRIRDAEIHAAIDRMRAADRATVVTPGKIHHALGNYGQLNADSAGKEG